MDTQSYTSYLNIRELSEVSVHGDESVIDQLLVVICPEYIRVLQQRRMYEDHRRTFIPASIQFHLLSREVRADGFGATSPINLHLLFTV